MSLHEGRLPALIHDVLETHYGVGFTDIEVLGLVAAIRPDAKEDTIRRTIWKLARSGHIERYVDREGLTRFVVRDRAYLKEA